MWYIEFENETLEITRISQQKLNPKLNRSIITTDNLPVPDTRLLKIQIVDGNYQLSKLNDDEIQELIKNLKDKLKYQANEITKNWINFYYPDWKKNSDLTDLNIHTSYLINLTNKNYNELQKEYALLAYKMYNENISIKQVLYSIEPELRTHVKQILKASIRMLWYRECKDIHNQYISKIEEIRTLEEIDNAPLLVTYIETAPFDKQTYTLPKFPQEILED